MNIAYSIKASEGNLWHIALGPVVLIEQLHLGPAINIARQMARDAYTRCGGSVCVEFFSAEEPVVLAHYEMPVEEEAQMVAA